jgi:hypothetical protein
MNKGLIEAGVSWEDNTRGKRRRTKGERGKCSLVFYHIWI